MDNFLPILNSNKHYALLKDSVRTCVLEELAQVQRETDEDDTKYKHVATEVSGNMCTSCVVLVYFLCTSCVLVCLCTSFVLLCLCTCVFVYNDDICLCLFSQ
jgi:hypothetical protein